MKIGKKKILSQDRLVAFYVKSCAILSLSLIVAIVFYTLFKGASRIDINFITSATENADGDGGILYQILGTLILVVTALVIVSPAALAFSILYSFVSNRIKQAIMAVLQILNATPSILFGILSFSFFIKLCGWEKTWLAGGIILSLMILPTVTVSLISRLNTIPKGYVETAKSLGLSGDQIIRSVILPYSIGGLWTGIVMGIARAAGETAPIMFVAVVFSGATLPSGITDSPVLALPYHIFNLAQDTFSTNALDSAWASSFILIMIVLSCSLILAKFRARSHEEAR